MFAGNRKVVGDRARGVRVLEGEWTLFRAAVTCSAHEWTRARLLCPVPETAERMVEKYLLLRRAPGPALSEDIIETIHQFAGRRRQCPFAHLLHEEISYHYISKGVLFDIRLFSLDFPDIKRHLCQKNARALTGEAPEHAL